MPRPVDEVAAFFEDPWKLESITPGWLSFHVVSVHPPRTEEGTLIEYRLRLLGVPFGWRTLIREHEPGRRFVDVQIKGPYALWEHEHRFTRDQDGTLITDVVRYRVGWGPLGPLIDHLFVKPRLKAIFDYRAEAVTRIFGGPP